MSESFPDFEGPVAPAESGDTGGLWDKLLASIEASIDEELSKRPVVPEPVFDTPPRRRQRSRSRCCCCCRCGG